MTFQLEDYQKSFISDINYKLTEHNAIVAQLATGGGKCLAKDTPVIMHDGSIKMVQDIKENDFLLGPDSEPRLVKSICRGREVMYKITPVKGDSYTVNESHILSLRMSSRAYNYKKGDIVNISVKDYLKTNKNFKYFAKGYRSNCIEFYKNENLNIDPYFLGLWLGDGNSRSSCITTGDIEIKKYLESFAENNMLRYWEEKNSANSINVHLPEIDHKGCKGSFIVNFLSSNNLILNKHIPFEYKTASENSRLKLLAGLIDSDGYLHHNNFDITLSNERLIDDIIFVARSLGFAAYKKEVFKTCTNNGVKGLYYNCLISGDTIRIPVKIERKKSKIRRQIKNVLNVGITVECVGEGDYYGFEIDGDHLFLLGDFTVTHNTVVFATLVNDFIKNTDKDVIIFVHKQELLQQTRITLNNWYGIISEEISADKKIINKNNLFGDKCRVFVAMVETFNNRSKKQDFLSYTKNVGLVIIDEAHLSNFKKIFLHFPLAMRIGFTGTPISATKKDPLLNYYSSIVCGPPIRTLIEHNQLNPKRGVVQDMTYVLKNISRKEIEQKHIELGLKGEEFDQDIVGKALSNKRQIQNTIDAYIKYIFGQKTLVFNSNVKHSQLVTDEMVKAGLNARHLDASCGEEYRRECFAWLHKTDNAILNNVGIATTGFDDPTIRACIINKMTKSLTLWIQMCGRSARPCELEDGVFKQYHTILDMGDNVIGGGHGEWSDDKDWEYIFHNPKNPRDGVAPVKECPECGCINYASARICKGIIQDFLFPDQMMQCDYEFPLQSASEDTIEKEMVMISKNINVKETIEFFKNRNEYFALWDIIRQSAYYAQVEFGEGYVMDNEEFEILWETLYLKIKEWIKLKGKRNVPWIKKECRVKLIKELVEHKFVCRIDYELHNEGEKDKLNYIQ